MATYTSNYGLHQWVAEDDFLRTDFNTDFQKIDQALGNLSLDKAQIVVGSYTGNGSSSRTITLGFQPQALYICNQVGMAGYIEGYYYTYGGLVLPGIPIIDLGHNSATAVELTSTGFKLSRDQYRKVNESNEVYLYWALQ